MQRDINSFPIPPSFRAKLNNAGFSSVADVLELKPSELSKGEHASRIQFFKLLCSVPYDVYCVVICCKYVALARLH